LKHGVVWSLRLTTKYNYTLYWRQ